MYNFSDFDIQPTVKSFQGEKIAVKKILNLSIKLLEYKIEPSKQKPGTDLLTLQIEKGGEKRVVFTGSSVLISQIKRVPEDRFPFTTTIKNESEYYEFT